MLELKIQGRGGQGAQVAGEVLATAFFRAGRYVQAFSSYGGARRGTPVSTFIRVDDTPIRLRCDIEEPDVVVSFDSTLLSPALLAGATRQTIVLINSSRSPADFSELGFPRLATVDGLAIAQASGLGRIVNSAVLGALARLLGDPGIDFLAEVIGEVSPAKQEQNARSAREGYRLVKVSLEMQTAGAEPTAAQVVQAGLGAGGV